MYESVVDVRLLSSTSKLPVQAHESDAGWDVHSNERLILWPGDFRAVGTGIRLDIKPGWMIQVHSRSGLAAKFGVAVLNAPGIVDAGYQGEVKVILINLGHQEFRVEVGERIAQLIPVRLTPALFRVTSEVPEVTDRGDSGMGSTGR